MRGVVAGYLVTRCVRSVSVEEKSQVLDDDHELFKMVLLLVSETELDE